MTKPSIDIKIDDRQVLDALNRLVELGRDMRPVMRDISTVLMGVVRDAFDTETDPATGEKWPDLSPKTTIPRREASGHWPGSVLQVTGQLAASIQPDYGADYAVAGTNRPYASTHQFGARMGEFGRYSQISRRSRYKEGDFRRNAGTVKGFPIPWGDIPARPFLGLSDEGREDILDVLRQHLSRALEG
jgi:phage virion morphogenesis protein